MAKLGQAETTWLWHSHQHVDDFGFFCNHVEVKLTKEIIKRIVEYFQQSENPKHTVISAKNLELYGNGKLGVVDLLIQLKSSGLIRKDDKGIYYYDDLQEIFHEIGFNGYSDILTDNAVPCPLPAIPAAFKAFRDNRHKSDRSLYSCNWILKNNPGSKYHLGNGLKKLLPDEMNRLVDYITLSSEDMLGVTVLNAGERTEYHQKEGNKGPSELCTTLWQSGIIYNSGPSSYLYCDVLVEMLKLLGMGGRADELFEDESINSGRGVNSGGNGSGGGSGGGSGSGGGGGSGGGSGSGSGDGSGGNEQEQVRRLDSTLQAECANLLEPEQRLKLQLNLEQNQHIPRKNPGDRWYSCLWCSCFKEAPESASIEKHPAAAISGLDPPGELSLKDFDPNAVYVSKCDPKDLGNFAISFGQKINKDQVAVIARYLDVSGEHLFKRIIISADDLIEYDEGKNNGRHLIRGLRDRGVITKLSDGTFNYNGLVKLLFAVKMRWLSDQLLQKQP